jgi:hypothetical protein
MMEMQPVAPINPKWTRDVGPMSKWILAADIGQAIDPTALAVLEVQTRRHAVSRYNALAETDRPADAVEPRADWFVGGQLKHPTAIARIDVHHLERLPLRMPYPDQIAHVSRLLHRPPLDVPAAALCVDSTGVGRPVVDMFRRAGLKPIAVTITGGDQESRVDGASNEYRVAKLLLVSRLQAMFNERTLRIPKDHPEARVLSLELQDFRATMSEAGTTRFGAREGAHDDLVLALAIGCWYAWHGQQNVASPFYYRI